MQQDTPLWNISRELSSASARRYHRTEEDSGNRKLARMIELPQAGKLSVGMITEIHLKLRPWFPLAPIRRRIVNKAGMERKCHPRLLQSKGYLEYPERRVYPKVWSNYLSVSSLPVWSWAMSPTFQYKLIKRCIPITDRMHHHYFCNSKQNFYLLSSSQTSMKVYKYIAKKIECHLQGSTFWYTLPRN